MKILLLPKIMSFYLWHIESKYEIGKIKLLTLAVCTYIAQFSYEFKDHSDVIEKEFSMLLALL